jgi:hypothetical protein
MIDAVSGLRVGIVGMEKVNLAAERRLARAILGDELLENHIGRVLVKTLLDEHPNHPILKLFQNIIRAPGCHAGDRHEERCAGQVVPVGALGLATGVPQLLLPLALFAIAGLV